MASWKPLRAPRSAAEQHCRRCSSRRPRKASRPRRSPTRSSLTLPGAGKTQAALLPASAPVVSRRVTHPCHRAVPRKTSDEDAGVTVLSEPLQK